MTSEDAATFDGGLDQWSNGASPDFGGARPRGSPGRGAPQRLDWNVAYRRNAPLGEAQYVSPFMPSIISSASGPTPERMLTRQAGHGGFVSLTVALPNFAMAACSHASSSAGVPDLNDVSACF